METAATIITALGPLLALFRHCSTVERLFALQSYGIRRIVAGGAETDAVAGLGRFFAFAAGPGISQLDRAVKAFSKKELSALVLALGLPTAMAAYVPGVGEFCRLVAGAAVHLNMGFALVRWHEGGHGEALSGCVLLHARGDARALQHGAWVCANRVLEAVRRVSSRSPSRVAAGAAPTGGRPGVQPR